MWLPCEPALPLVCSFSVGLLSSVMDKFIRRLPHVLKHMKDLPKLGVVIGNESGDLDSAVSSVVYAYHLHEQRDFEHIPVLNFPREDLALKTEVRFCFKKLQLNPDHLIYVDDVPWKELEDVLEVTLVDHNVINHPDLTFLEPKVVAVFDHHVQERTDIADLDFQLEFVGSTSSLIAERMFEDNPDMQEEIVLKLIRWTIITDTANLSPAKKKATPLDIDILERIENILAESACSMWNRKDIYEEILKFKSDTSNFTCNQLLRKDLKIVYFKSPQIQVSMSSLPGAMSCSKLMKMANFRQELEEFHRTGEYSLSIALGAGDLMIYPKHSEYSSMVRDKLLSKNPDIKMRVDSGQVQSTSPDIEYMRRSNVTYTRKKIMPLVKEAIGEC
eukprot:maker-scaffold240_size241964-snap-gene-1.20 protein:Tk08267 transcript:maker-scaffold240_size241964-snap-gene-1.20-mRNA-1 annotation:"hypothetical protein BRAFLDRAFT_239767"